MPAAVKDWARSKVDSIPKRGKGTKNSVDNFSSPAVKPASAERIVYSERMPALPSVSPSPLFQHVRASRQDASDVANSPVWSGMAPLTISAPPGMLLTQGVVGPRDMGRSQPLFDDDSWWW
eukprot:jgi/Tetstr1/439434/TSEL_027868.t1